MKEKVTYPNIDMKMTGLRLKRLISNAGYAVKDIQNYLQLSCPQPIYRWYKGLILPSVDHLFMLSELLNVHMEDLLVKKTSEMITYDVVCFHNERKEMYIGHLLKLVYRIYRNTSSYHEKC